MRNIVLLTALCVLAACPCFSATFGDGNAAYEHGDYQGALKVLQPLAEHGDAAAQYVISNIYRKGGPGVEKSPDAAMKWLQSSAGNGNVEAEIMLGSLYYVGSDDLRQDKTKADNWCSKAAKQLRKPAESGDGVAQKKMAGLYIMGLKPNVKEEYYWLSLAAINKVEFADSDAKLVAEKLSLKDKAEVDKRVRQWQVEHSRSTP